MVATVKQCLFDTNLADFGGGIFRGSANGDISGNVFQNNRAIRIGGAIYDSHSQVGPAHAMSVLPHCCVRAHCADLAKTGLTSEGKHDTHTLCCHAMVTLLTMCRSVST